MLQLGNALVFEASLRQLGFEMRSRYLIHHPDRAHFVTSTIVEWLPVFTSSTCCDIVVNSLHHCREHKKLKIYAWVILDRFPRHPRGTRSVSGPSRPEKL
jgi:hypothetical protein